MSIYIYILIIFIIIGIVALVANAVEDHNDPLSFDTSIKLNNMPIVSFKHNDMDVYFLIDSGSDVSYIDESILHRLTIKEKIGEGYDVLTANGYMHTYGNVVLEFMHGDKPIEGEFTVGNIKDAMDCAFAPNWEVRGIIGSIILKKYNYVIDYKNNELRCKRRKRNTKTCIAK